MKIANHNGSIKTKKLRTLIQTSYGALEDIIIGLGKKVKLLLIFRYLNIASHRTDFSFEGLIFFISELCHVIPDLLIRVPQNSYLSAEVNTEPNTHPS
jgi:hypothetical protein